MNGFTAIQNELFKSADLKYKSFYSALIPNIDPENVIGVRTPVLRAIAKQLSGTPEAAGFLRELPHRYYEENNLHCFIIEQISDFDECIKETERFLPFIDNWGTCDTFSPKVFKKNAEQLLPYIEKWLKSDRTYTVRYAIGMLQRHFLDERFNLKYLQAVSNVPTEEYYLHMMVAWYFATALAKQYDAALPYLTEQRLDAKTHNKAIQKAVENCRITPEQKAFLRTLKIK